MSCLKTIDFPWKLWKIIIAFKILRIKYSRTKFKALNGTVLFHWENLGKEICNMSSKDTVICTSVNFVATMQEELLMPLPNITPPEMIMSHNVFRFSKSRI